MLCQARLTNYHKTKTKIGTQTKWNATYLKLCDKEAMEGSDLCARCAQRPTSARNQITMIHGKLSEEIPYTSRIYGGDWYWDMVQQYGEPLDKQWLELAKQAQLEGEKRAGAKAWRIPEREAGRLKEKKKPERPVRTKEEIKPVEQEEAIDEMPPKKKLPPAPPSQQLPFKPISQLMQESSEEPKMLPTDRQKLWKENGVWICETGFTFAVKEDGGIGKFLGKN